MSVSSNRASNCARRLVQEKVCNLLFNNNQKCITVKRQFGSFILPQTTTNSFMKIYQGNNKFGTFINSIRHSQVSCHFIKVCQIFNFFTHINCITKIKKKIEAKFFFISVPRVYVLNMLCTVRCDRYINMITMRS